MPAATGERMRVLIANLSPIASLGLRRLLEKGGAEVFEDAVRDWDVAGHARDVRPDVIVLGLGGSSTRDRARAVHRELPGVKLIVWPREGQAIEVLDPGADEPRVRAGADDHALIDELTAIGHRIPETKE